MTSDATIRNTTDFANYLKCTIDDIPHLVYRCTNYGVHITVSAQGIALSLDMDEHKKTIGAYYLCFPFSECDFAQTLAHIETEADVYWRGNND